MRAFGGRRLAAIETADLRRFLASSDREDDQRPHGQQAPPGRCTRSSSTRGAATPSACERTRSARRPSAPKAARSRSRPSSRRKCRRSPRRRGGAAPPPPRPQLLGGDEGGVAAGQRAGCGDVHRSPPSPACASASCWRCAGRTSTSRRAPRSRWRGRCRRVWRRAPSRGASGRCRWPIRPQAELKGLSRRQHFTASRPTSSSVAPTAGRWIGRAVRNRFVRAQKKAGVKVRRFHDLRHTFGSLAVRTSMRSR